MNSRCLRGASVPTLLILLFLVPVLLHAGSHRFVVAPGGNDRNPGSPERPFRTIERARDAVRALRAGTPAPGDTVFILLRAGTYALRAPLRLGPADGGTAASPTVYAAWDNERPVISGGVAVRGWKRTTLDGKAVLAADLPGNVRRARPAVRELWVNGGRRTPARFPNRGYLAVDSIPEVNASTHWMDGQRSFVARNGDIPRPFDLRGAHAVVTNRWVESHMPVTGFDHANATFRFSRRSVFRLDRGDLYYLLFARGALDEPGEWWIDPRAGRIYYMPLPGEDPATFEAVVPLLEQLLLIDGAPAAGRWVEHLVFRGLTFSHAEWFFPEGYKTDSRNADAGGFLQAATGVPAAVACTGMRNSLFEECTIAHCGTYGISFGAACRDNTLQRSALYDLGAGGVFAGLRTIEENRDLLTQRNRFLDNHIHDGGKIFHSAIGIWIGQSPHNRIIHNHIHDFHYTGISIGWTWGYGRALAYGNVVTFNHVHHIGTLTDGDGPILSDLGGIYTLGFQRGTVIRRNVFHHIGARVYGGWGIYFDEGSTGVRAEENLVYRTLHGGFHQHYGKNNIFRNNILAFGEEYQVRRDRVEPHTSFAFENNIILWNGDRLSYGNMRDGDLVMDRNLYWPVGGTFIMDSLDFTAWQKHGQDRRSVIADPLFADPAADDYRLREGSPAFGLGFRPFDIGPALSPVPVGDTTLPPPFTRRFLYNNDGSSIPMGYDSLTPRKAWQRIDPLAGSGVTTFIYNVNPGQNPGYPSTVESMFHWADPPADATEGWGLLGRRMSENLARLVADSIDPVEMVMERARLRGMEPFLSYRMNELHDVDKPDSPLLGEFWKAHPEWRVGGYAGWGKEALNYAVPEVREYFFALVKETLERYDMAGFELDFMRFPHYFPLRPDSMTHFAGILTDFVGRVRRLTDSLAAERGHPILLGARVPSSLKGCAHLAADPAAWCRNGFIDFLVVAPFLSTENDIDAREFKAVCGDVPVFTAQEFTMGPRQMTRAEKRATAALQYASGADGLYLFNYFVAWDLGLEADTEVLPDLADPAHLVGKDKLYTLAVPWFPVPGISKTSPLPLALRKAQLESVMMRVHEPVRPERVLLRIECAAAVDPDDLHILFNGTNLGAGVRPVQAQIFPETVARQTPDVTKTVEFAVDPALLREENRIGIHAGTAMTVEWVYLGVMHGR